MNLLFMQNGLAPYGIPRNGLVALYDPYKDTYGRNILPVGSENFVTGWTKRGTANVTSADIGYHVTGITINNTGDLYLNPYVTIAPSANINISIMLRQVTATGTLSLQNPVSETFGEWHVDLSKLSNNYELITTTHPAVTVVAPFKSSNINGTAGIMFRSVADTIAFDAYQPQVNLGQLYPYAPPSGLPQSATDYTGRGNNAQLGSTAGSDTNDPAWNGGLVFGTDDYCKSSSPAFDDLPQFTCITVCKPLSAGSSGYGKIWEKGPNCRLLRLGSDSTLHYAQFRQSGNDRWTTDISFGVNQIISLRYNSMTPDTAPKININTNTKSIARSTTGTGNVISDASYDLAIGNTLSGGNEFGGSLYIQLWYNRILSDAEYMQAYNGLRRLMSARGVVI